LGLAHGMPVNALLPALYGIKSRQNETLHGVGKRVHRPCPIATSEQRVCPPYGWCAAPNSGQRRARPCLIAMSVRRLCPASEMIDFTARSLPAPCEKPPAEMPRTA